MLKWFNKKKKDNKGFTLVELIIVIAILAILVGLLAPQYVKYVEKSRRSADASNLESFVESFKVAAADVDYNLTPTTGNAVYTITIDKNGTSITAGNGASDDWATAINEYTGYNFKGGENGAASTITEVKLKSTKWSVDNKTQIQAIVTISTTGSVKVEYKPDTIKDTVNTKN